MNRTSLRPDMRKPETVENRDGNPRAQWARSHRNRCTEVTGLQGLTRKQRGCDPGSASAPCTATLGYRTPDLSICRTPKRSWTKEFVLLPLRSRSDPITSDLSHHNTRRPTVKLRYLTQFRGGTRRPRGPVDRAQRRPAAGQNCRSASCRRGAPPDAAAHHS